MALEDLNIRISADTADFIAGAEGVESQLGDLSSEAIQTAGALEVLSNRADDAGDNVSQAGRRATTASGQFSTLTTSVGAANVSFMGLSATTIGSLIPAVVALGAALAPVVGALGGFVAVAGSIGAVGFLPVIGAIATNTERLKTTFNSIITTIQSEFAPVFDMAAASLLFLMEQFESMLTQIAPSGSIIGRIARNFEILGTTIIRSIPAFVELAGSLTTEFLPPFRRWMADILPQIPGMVRSLVDILRRMIPRFQEAGSTLMEILPPFTEFGFTVLEVLGPALATAAEVGTDFLEWFNQLPKTTQQAGAALSLLAPVISVVGGLFSSQLIGTVIRVGRVMLGFISRIVALGGILGPAGLLGAAIVGAVGLFVRFEDEIRNIVSQVLPLLSTAVNRVLNWIQTNGPGLARNAMNALGTAIRATLNEIAAILIPGRDSVIIGAFKDMTAWLISNGPGFVSKAWDNLVSISLAAWEGFRNGLFGEGSEGIIPQTINDTVDWLISTGASLILDAVSFIASVLLTPFKSTFNQLFNLFRSAFNDIASGVNDVIDRLPSSIVQTLDVQRLEPIDFERRTTDPASIASQTQEEIRVVLDERTDVVEARIENGARNVVNEESRAARRSTGTPSGVR